MCGLCTFDCVCVCVLSSSLFLCLLLCSGVYFSITVAGSIPDHPISLELAWDLEIGVNIMLCAFLNVAGTSCTPVGVCTESRGVYCKGRHVLCVCNAVCRVQTCFFSQQTSCATLLPASIAQVLVTSRLAPHFTATPSQQDGSQMKYKNVSELKKINPFQVMEAGHARKASCC